MLEWLSKRDAIFALVVTLVMDPNWSQTEATGLGIRGKMPPGRSVKMSTMEPALLSRLMPAYERARSEDRVRLQTALASDDFKALEKLGHKIKGSAATYGFEKTAELGQRLQMTALQRSYTDCAEIVREMESLFFKA
jgi:histidine phosphotransfer protein HptB